MLIRSLMIFIVAATCSSTFLNSAHAQSCAEEDNLLACEFLAIEDCRTSVGCPDDRRQGITVQDLVDEAAARCCDKNTNKAVKKCLKKYRRFIGRSKQRAPSGSVKSFLQETKGEINTLLSNGCSTGTLGDL